MLALLFLILIINNWAIPFWDQDEPAYAGFARNMLATGDWVVPDFFNDWTHDHRKTPLHFWDIAISFKVFGQNEFATRFPSVLAVFGTLLLLLNQGVKITKKDSSFWGVVALGTSFLVSSVAKISVTDATVLFFSTLSAFGMINTIINPSKKWIFLFWLGFGLGVLTKGPPIIVFTGVFAVFLFAFHPNRMNIFKLRPWFFLPLALAPVIFWGYATYLRDGGVFLDWMYWWYVEKRVAGAVYDQTGPPGMHIALMAVFFLPFLMYFFTGIGNGIKKALAKDSDFIIIIGWLVSGWLLYEFSPSKLPAYVIVAHVPLALLIGIQAQTVIDNRAARAQWTVVVHYVLNYALAIALAVAPMIMMQFEFLKDMSVPMSLRIMLTSVGVIYTILLSIQLLKFNNKLYIPIQFGSAIIFTLSLWLVAPEFTKLTNSSKEVGRYVTSQVAQSYTIVIAHGPGRQPSLPFYLGDNGNKVILESNLNALLELVESNEQYAFVLNENQVLAIQKKRPELIFHKIESQLIDRKDKAVYYILIVS